MRKKGFGYVVILSLALLLSACGSNATPQDQSAPVSATSGSGTSSAAEGAAGSGGATPGAAETAKPSLVTSPMSLTMAAGSAGGNSQAIGEAIGEAIKKTVPGTSFTYQPSKYGANAPIVGKGQTELGMEGGEMPYWSYKGIEIYSEATPDLRVVSFLHNAAFTMTMAKDTGITSLEQMIEEKYPAKLSVNTKNGLIEMPTRFVLEAYGTNYEEIESWGGQILYAPSKEADELFKNRKVDGYFVTTQHPLATFQDVYSARAVNFLPLSEEAIQHVQSKLKSAVPFTLPAGTYEGLEEDYKTFSTPMFLVSNAHVPDDVIYTVTKAIYDNIEYLHSASKVLEDLTHENMVPQAGIPIHPGAEAFYKEVGLLR